MLRQWELEITIGFTIMEYIDDPENDNFSGACESENLIGIGWIKNGMEELRMNTGNCFKEFYCKVNKISMEILAEESDI